MLKRPHGLSCPDAAWISATHLERLTAAEKRTFWAVCPVEAMIDASTRVRTTRRSRTGAPVRILIVEDDPRLADVVRRGLEESGHVVDIEHDGDAGAASAEGGNYDAIVLDVMLPRRDGYDVARAARSAGIATPILMLTARDATEDVVAGIAAGADDYLRKPFAFAELEARLHAITRRKAEPLVDELRVGELIMDLRGRTVRRGARPLTLTAREIAFLEYFMRNPGRLLTRAMLEDALWERDRDTMSNVVDVYVRRLRAKLSPDGEVALIETVRGMGYRLRAHAGQ